MSLLQPYARDVVIVRAGATSDRYNPASSRPDWGTATRTTVQAVVEQSASAEDLDSRDTVTSSWRLYSLPGVDLDLTAYDRIEVDGQTFEVDGAPAHFTGRGGSVHHVEARLVEVTG